MHTPVRLSRRAFTLIEMLVVIAIIVTLMGLTIPAVQKARQAGNRAKAMNNIRSLALAAQQAHDMRRKLPYSSTLSLYGGRPGSVLYQLLPYLEEQSIYNVYSGNYGPALPNPGPYTPSDNTYATASSLKVAIFQSPSDFTVGDGTIGGFGASSFAWNNQLDGLRMPDNIADGTSKTIMFTEKMAGYPNSGTVNNQWGTPVNAQGTAAAPNLGPVIFLGFEPVFAPITATKSSGFGNAPVTPNSDVIIVAFADSATRFFNNSIANAASNTTGETVWTTLMTPSGNDNLGEDNNY